MFYSKLLQTLAAARRALSAYGNDLTRIAAFFILTVTLINLAKAWFGFVFIHIFDLTFSSFRAWCHLVLHVLLFYWVILFVKACIYAAMKILSEFSDFRPYWPHIVFPPLLSDLALVSLAFTRVFQTTDLVVPRTEREQAEKQMTDDLWIEIEIAEGPFWGSVHKALDKTNARIWHVVDTLQRVMVWPFPNGKKYSALARRTAIALLGAVFFWGFIRLAGYVINIIGSHDLSSPIMVTRRRFFRYFCIHFAGAVIAAAIFIVLNGWVIDWVK